jgi:hypothetical protein
MGRRAAATYGSNINSSGYYWVVGLCRIGKDLYMRVVDCSRRKATSRPGLDLAANRLHILFRKGFSIFYPSLSLLSFRVQLNASGLNQSIYVILFGSVAC